MITIHHSTETGLEITERPVKGCWIQVTDPTPDEVKSLPQDWSIPPEFITPSLGRGEISRIERSDEALLILVRIPHFQGAASSIPYVTVPMGIIVTDEWVMTICRHEHKLLHDLPHEHQIDLSTVNATRFVLHLLWSVANSYILHLREIDESVERVEDRLQRSLQNREVLELLRYQKSLVYFTTALQANETMQERLYRSKSLKLEPRDEDLMDDVFTENHQAIGLSEISSNILSQMMDAFASIISNNLNVVMKFLASLAVILVVPTIISSFYGMNVGLPLADHPLVFLILVGLSFVIALVIALILWKRNWL
jgi:magnesium transporter